MKAQLGAGQAAAASPESGCRATARCGLVRHGRLRYRLPPLPPDMLDEECSEVILFRLSLLLNRLTGGPSGMTFSARCYRAQRLAHLPLTWLAWRLTTAGIDLACQTLRGEIAHCETAWRNHCARGGGRTFARQDHRPPGGEAAPPGVPEAVQPA